eukprot:100742_1
MMLMQNTMVNVIKNGFNGDNLKAAFKQAGAEMAITFITEQIKNVMNENKEEITKWMNENSNLSESGDHIIDKVLDEVVQSGINILIVLLSSDVKDIFKDIETMWQSGVIKNALDAECNRLKSIATLGLDVGADMFADYITKMIHTETIF